MIRFIYLGSIISKGGGSSKNVKSRVDKAQGVFSQLKQVWKNRKISLQTNIRILEATVITVVKYGSEAWALRKFTRCFPEKLPTDCSGYPAD